MNIYIDFFTLHEVETLIYKREREKRIWWSKVIFYRRDLSHDSYLLLSSFTKGARANANNEMYVMLQFMVIKLKNLDYFLIFKVKTSILYKL